jgi:hypothetical protein
MPAYKWKRSRVKRIDVCYLVGASQSTRCSNGEIELVACNTPPADSGRQDTVTVNQSLLLQEVEETNSWVRSGVQLFIGWFALQFIVNIAAIGWLVIYRGPVPTFSRSVYGVLIGWNLLGAIGSLLIQKTIHDCDLRIREVIGTLTKNNGPGDMAGKSQSGIPLRAINVACIFCAVTFFIFFAFWTIQFVS